MGSVKCGYFSILLTIIPLILVLRSRSQRCRSNATPGHATVCANGEFVLSRTPIKAALYDEGCNPTICFESIDSNYLRACIDPFNQCEVKVSPGPRSMAKPTIALNKTCAEVCPGVYNGFLRDEWFA